jgi:NADPH:quinone reductase-like Zn-dependent oxidoreductase
MERTTPHPDGVWYEIRVQGRLDPRWTAWLGDMTVATADGPTTLVRGRVIDQPALHGLLARFRDLGVPLLSVNQVHQASQAPDDTLAMTQTVYGSPSTLSLAHVPRPTPGAGEVLIEVHAASVNARDWHIMRGEPRLARLLDPTIFGRRGPRVATRGTDLAGIVLAVGAGVGEWKAGDRVFGEGVGAFARHAVARADQLAEVPTGIDFEHAAAVPLAATTASLCVNAADPTPGSTILINGASGGVGTFAIQLAKARGLHVTAVVSTRNAAQAEDLGADRVIDHTSHSVLDGATYDVVVDLVGNLTLRELRSLLRPHGALVLSGGGVSGKGRTVGSMKLLIWAQLYSRFSALRLFVPQATPHTPVLKQLAGLIAAGKVTPVIDRRFDLEHAADAIDYLETEHARAKVVLTITHA